MTGKFDRQMSCYCFEPNCCYIETVRNPNVVRQAEAISNYSSKRKEALSTIFMTCSTRSVRYDC